MRQRAKPEVMPKNLRALVSRLRLYPIRSDA